MKITLFRRWLTEPSFSLKLFIGGLLPFFSGITLTFLAKFYWPPLLDLAWVLIIVGILIALPGYIGIWRWRWIQFKNDK